MRITVLVNLRSVSVTNGKEHDIERRTRPRARIASRHMPASPSFDPKPASRTWLKLTSSSQHALAVDEGSGCKWCNGGCKLLCGHGQLGQLVGMVEMARAVAVVLERAPLGQVGSDRAALS